MGRLVVSVVVMLVSLGINDQSVLNFVETNFLMGTNDFRCINGMMFYKERSAII